MKSAKCKVKSAKGKVKSDNPHFALCPLHLSLLTAYPVTPSPPHPATPSPSRPFTPSPRHPPLVTRHASPATRHPPPATRRSFTRGALWAALILCVAAAGCAPTKMASLRPVPKNALIESLKLTAGSGLQPSERTRQFLRVYDLSESLNGDPQTLLQKVQAVVEREPCADNVYAIAELSYLQGKRVETSDPQLALNFFGASVLHAHDYLFGERYRAERNPFDPHFRGACDLYNGALEEALRLLCKQKALVPGNTYTIRTAGGNWDVACVIRGGNWRQEDFDHFEFVSDYEIKGLNNHYLTYGLGVPLIAVRKSYAGEPPFARYYPPDLSFPVTAFLRPDPGMETALAPEAAGRHAPSGVSSGRRRAVLELYDPLAVTDVAVGGAHVSLESDLSTPLAYFLSQINMDTLAYAGLLRPDLLLTKLPNMPRPIMGLYMVQPYEPGKIPVILVHGLWSSPMTWMQMFNDLRSSTEIRENYQIWFYLYPTAQPFWITAAQMRADLAEMRQVLDPERREPALDQMVLVGHSMGGLISRMQTLNSRNDFWNAVSQQPLDQLKAAPEVRQRMQDAFFFQPNPSVRRVITLATPHHGSYFSNNTTQWLMHTLAAAKLIRLPQMLLQSQQALFRDNSGFFPDGSLGRIETSIDSLAPDSPIFPVMLASQRAPWVTYHNILGVAPYHGLLGKLMANSDGVVAVDSARVDDAVSELVVPADHSGVHSHPLAVLEVRRILLEHLAELRAPPAAPQSPVAQSPSASPSVARSPSVAQSPWTVIGAR
jgi:pimeloyl-ACP methyl ester carboxylesterase